MTPVTELKVEQTVRFKEHFATPFEILGHFQPHSINVLAFRLQNVHEKVVLLTALTGETFSNRIHPLALHIIELMAMGNEIIKFDDAVIM